MDKWLFFQRRIYHMFGAILLCPSLDTAARFNVICENHHLQLDAILDAWMETVTDEELLKVIERISPVLNDYQILSRR